MADEPTDKQTLLTRALMILGHGAIGLDDDTEASETANEIFNLTIDQVFGLYSWSFATRIVKLQQISEPAISPRPYAFMMPGGLLEPVKAVYSNLDPLTPDRGYMVTETTIYSHHAALWALVRIVPPIAAWPAGFRAAFTKALVSELSIPIAELTAVHERLDKQLYGRDWEAYQGGLFGRLIALDRVAQPKTMAELGDQLNAARKS